MARIRTHNHRAKRPARRSDWSKFRDLYMYQTYGRNFGKSVTLAMIRAAMETTAKEGIRQQIGRLHRFGGNEITYVVFDESSYIKPLRDIHSERARVLFGDDFTEEQRRRAKAINYGEIYGVDPKET